MRRSISLMLALVCLSFCLLEAASPNRAQPDLLQQPVTVNYQDVTLPYILRDLRDQYQIKFAYSNNEISEDQTFSIQANRQPLRNVLDELLQETGLSYRVVNGQVVLKRKTDAFVPSPSDATQETKAQQEASLLPGLSAKAVSSSSAKSKTAPASSPLPLNVVATSRPEESAESTPTPNLPDQLEGVTASSSTSTPDTESSEPKKNRPVSGKKISRNVRNAINKLMKQAPPDTSDYPHRRFHVGLVYPISTNGLQAGQMVNQVSVHLLAGYAAGLKGVEFSGLGNLENNFVQGAQFAGFFNIVKHRVSGVQAAGFVNINGGDTQGAQLSGYVNIGAGSVTGVQATGFVNIATASFQGVQLSGFVNLVSDSLRGVQSTGFVNIATKAVHGAQLSGYVNYAPRIKGLQATGFVNVAPREVRGGQVAGFVNYAGYVKGVQIGLLNIADSINGVPIGLFSIVRKNGYRRLELWYSEALQANIAFKMGVPRFYNMLVAGSDFTATDLRWGFGYGIGTLFPITSAFSMNLDLYAIQIQENNQDFLDNYALNLLNTLRLSLNLHLAKRIALFAAPTFNVMVSEYFQPDDGTIGSRIAPSWTIYNQTFNSQTNVKMWIGFQAGLRF